MFSLSALGGSGIARIAIRTIEFIQFTHGSPSVTLSSSGAQPRTLFDTSTSFPYQPPSEPLTITYDHIHEKVRDPVRSPLVKFVRAKLVLRSVTTGESLVLYVLFLQIESLIPIIGVLRAKRVFPATCSGPAAQEPHYGARRINPIPGLPRTTVTGTAVSWR